MGRGFVGSQKKVVVQDLQLKPKGKRVNSLTCVEFLGTAVIVVCVVLMSNKWQLYAGKREKSTESVVGKCVYVFDVLCRLSTG